MTTSTKVLLNFSMLDLVQNAAGTLFTLYINIPNIHNKNVKLSVKEFTLIRTNAYLAAPPNTEDMYFLTSNTLRYTNSLNARQNISNILATVNSRNLNYQNSSDDKYDVVFLNGEHTFSIIDTDYTPLSVVDIQNFYISLSIEIP